MDEELRKAKADLESALKWRDRTRLLILAGLALMIAAQIHSLIVHGQ